MQQRCNVTAMKRLQIIIVSARTKVALIRRYVRVRLRPLPPIEKDPLWGLVGMVEGAPDDSASVDDVVYGPRRAEADLSGEEAMQLANDSVHAMRAERRRTQ
jgi:hypothetical protein